MTGLEYELNATRGAVMALFLGDQQRTDWEPYREHGWMPVPGPNAMLATHIHVRNKDGKTVRIPLPGETPDGSHVDPTPERPYLVIPGVVCDLHWPVETP